MAKSHFSLEYPEICCTLSYGFEKRAASNPDDIAVTYNDENITYSNLHKKSTKLVNFLRNSMRVAPEQIVAISLDRSIEFITGLLGIIKSGAAYLPLDVNLPVNRFQFMLKNSGATILITNSTVQSRLVHFKGRFIIVDKSWPKLIEMQPSENVSESVTSTNLAYVIYTSGSTGQPKGVMIEHHSIVKLVTDPCFNLTRNSVIGQLSGVSFDVCAFEIWGALLNGGRLVIIPNNVLLNPKLFVQTIQKEKVIVVDITPALFSLIVDEDPAAFSGFHCVLVGGDSPSAKVFNQVRSSKEGAPKLLANVYGVTEATVTSTIYHAQENILSHIVPIGKPICNTKLYILSQSLEPLSDGEVGELFIGGDGLARGYLNQPKLTKQKFIKNPFTNEDKADRLYRTGDLVRRLTDGNLEFHGRIDDQVNIRGFRVELGEIEWVLSNHAGVKQAVALAREGQLLVFVLIEERHLNSGQEYKLVAELKSWIKSNLPLYMIPSGWKFMDSIPLTQNGKVDKQKLLEMYSSPANQFQCSMQQKKIRLQTCNGSAKLYEIIRKIWANLLNCPETKICLQNDFFELGGHSILAIYMAERINKLGLIGKNLAIADIFEHAALDSLISYIGNLESNLLSKHHGNGLDLDFVEDAKLNPDIQFTSTQIVNDLPKKILLTGATGYLGAYLLCDLLKKTQSRIYCLVRAEDKSEGLERIKANLQSYFLWNDTLVHNIEPVVGDLSKNSLGLSQQDYSCLIDNIDSIYHCGSEVNFIKPYSILKAANVSGTEQLIQLAALGKVKPFHYISTLGVFSFAHHTHIQHSGQPIKTIVTEDTPLAESLKTLHVDLGYDQSKWVAEQLVWAAMKRGLPASVYRPGFILCHSETGAVSSTDFWARLIRDCVRLGSYPELEGNREAFVTVDYVSRAIVHISLKKECLGKAYHLCPDSQEPSTDISSNELFEMITSMLGPTLLKPLPFRKWREDFLAYTKNGSSSFAPLIPMLSDEIYEEMCNIEAYQNYIPFGSENTKQARVGSGIVQNNIDVKMMERYFDYFCKRGFFS